MGGCGDAPARPGVKQAELDLALQRKPKGFPSWPDLKAPQDTSKGDQVDKSQEKSTASVIVTPKPTESKIQ